MVSQITGTARKSHRRDLRKMLLISPRSALVDFGESHNTMAVISEKSPTMGRKNANLRSEMMRLLPLAGVSGWPRLFHSVKFQEGRASRQTELQFPLHGVCSWLGNSPRIAQQSYLLVTEDDFAQGGRGEEGDGIDIKYGEQSDRLAPRSATSAVNAVKTRNQTTEHIAEPPVVHS